MQYTAVQYCKVQCSTLHYTALHYTTAVQYVHYLVYSLAATSRKSAALCVWRSRSIGMESRAKVSRGVGVRESRGIVGIGREVEIEVVVF